MSDHLRRLSLFSGLPYLRQVVTVRGEVFTVMAYDFCNPPRVQLAPGIRHTALGWDTDSAEWIPWGKCALSKEDADLLRDFKAGNEAIRKPLPPPTKVHPAKREPSRQEAKSALRRTRSDL